MKNRFDRLYSEHWGILEVMITDHSPIDLNRLCITSRADAHHFVLNYGYDLDQPEEAAEVEQIRKDALRFIQTYFLDTLVPEYRPMWFPQAIQNAGAIDLLLLASANPRGQLQKWACAVLRVMHTISHAVTDLSTHFFADIQKQILTPYYKNIHHMSDGLFLGKDPSFRIPLVDFEVKAGKERDSAILKLLHKAENVAADIFDQIGVRFVTEDRLDAILVLHYLRENHIVPFPNVKPSRSVNTLIHIEKFRRTFRELYKNYRQGQIEKKELEDFLRHSAQFRDVLTDRQVHQLFNRNPYTSRQYRSMQFTVRQLVRINNPLYPYKQQLADENEGHPATHARIQNARPYYRFYFPYEVQIVDVKTHQNNISGAASHEVYKHRQLVSARERVLGALLKPAEHPAAGLQSWQEESELA